MWLIKLHELFKELAPELIKNFFIPKFWEINIENKIKQDKWCQKEKCLPNDISKFHWQIGILILEMYAF